VTLFVIGILYIAFGLIFEGRILVLSGLIISFTGFIFTIIFSVVSLFVPRFYSYNIWGIVFLVLITLIFIVVGIFSYKRRNKYEHFSFNDK
jgi:hypothetical protein